MRYFCLLGGGVVFTGSCRCIDALPVFIQPILDGICALTGGTATFMWGGPEPKDQGHLNIVQYVSVSRIYLFPEPSNFTTSCHSGKTIPKMGLKEQVFSESEQGIWEQQIIPAYSNFLRKCFSTS